MKQIIPINALKDDIAPCLPSHYYKAGWRDFKPKINPQHIPHLAILEIEMEETKTIQIGSYSPSYACNAKGLDSDGICPTLLDHKGAEPAIIQRPHGYFPGGMTHIAPCVKASAYVENNLLQEPCILGYTRDNKGDVQNYHERELAGTLHTSSGQGGNTDQFVKEQVIGSMQANAMRGSIDGVSPCLTEAMGMGGGQVPMVTERMSRKDDVAFKKMPDGNIHTFRAHDPRKSTAPEWQITNENNVHPTITSSHEPKVLLKYRIRKLTPTECLRLMGVDDSDIEKMKSAKLTQTLKNGKVKERPMPKTQLYKMAGNSIVVDVLYHIFHQMFIAEPPKPKPIQKSLFDI